MKNNSRRATFVLLFLHGFRVFVPQASAGVDSDFTCRFMLHDERLELDDQVLRVDLVESTFTATEEIFVLVDGLGKNDAVQRMVFLGYKHGRDTARLELERQTKFSNGRARWLSSSGCNANRPLKSERLAVFKLSTMRSTSTSKRIAPRVS